MEVSFREEQNNKIKTQCEIFEPEETLKLSRYPVQRGYNRHGSYEQ